MTEQINKALKTKRDLTSEFGREPSFAEIGEVLDVSAEKAQEILGHGRDPISIHTRVGDDQTAELGEFIEDIDAPIALEVVSYGLLQDEIKKVLKTLDEREALVMSLRFGLLDGKTYTLDEVGKRIGLTRERVRQIEKKTLQKLRVPSRADRLKDFYQDA
jgi:RNA polymerase primary sigma factor